MPITFACGCGKTLRVGDEHAGRRARCPACGAVTDPGGGAPAAAPPPEPAAADEPVFEVVEGPPAGTRAARPPKPKPPKKRRPAADPGAYRPPPPARWQGEFRTEAVAWIAAGGLIFLVFLYIAWFHWRWVKGLDDHEWGVRAVIAVGVIGFFAAAKGVYMLVYGSYPEND